MGPLRCAWLFGRPNRVGRLLRGQFVTFVHLQDGTSPAKPLLQLGGEEVTRRSLLELLRVPALGLAAGQSVVQMSYKKHTWEGDLTDKGTLVSPG